MNTIMSFETILFNLEEYSQVYLTNLGVWGGVIGCLLIIVESMLPVLPLFVFITLAFYAFGDFLGFILSWISTCLGCFISFSLFRSKIKGWFEKKFVKPNSQVKKIVKVIDKMKMSSLALLVAIPFTPAFAINIAAGLSNIPKRKFIYAILIGKMFMVYFWGYIGTTLIESITHPIYLVKILLMLVMAFIVSKIVTKVLKVE